jgi:shikimate kinase/3-dehydroquinate synthase
MIRLVVLVGLSGTGKSSVARLAANVLGWELVDTDARIEQETGRSIPEIFRSDGESSFRSIEAAVMRGGLARGNAVIATGGGAVIDPVIWADDLLGRDDVLVVWLDASPRRLVERLRAQAAAEGSKADRPLLEGDPLARISAMREQRAAMYGRSDVALDVENHGPEAIASMIVELARLGNGNEVCSELQVESATSTIRVGLGGRTRLAQLIGTRWPRAQQIWVVTDQNLAPHVGTVVDGMRAQAGIPVNVLAVPPGEGSKSLKGVSTLYDWMLGGGVERNDVAVALGGGMVGDLTGFAAATVLRGIGLVQVPTTLLAMVDSSVGGKTGINHRAGKNLIGAFYQPPEVVIDPELLATLPPRELRSGWAEIVKHAVIEPSTPGGNPPVLLDVLERNVDALNNGRQPLLAWLIGRNVVLKAAVVAADEREAGIRALLNLGHTIGHGIEAAGYALLHGEAVAVGMRAAFRIAVSMGLADESQATRTTHLLEAFSLPTTAHANPALVREKMASDKKKESGKQKWVLPVREGGVRIVTDVPDELIERALAEVTDTG